MIDTMVGMQAAKRLAGAESRRLMAAMTAAFAAGQLAGPLALPYVMGAEGDFSKILLLAAGALLTGTCLLPLRTAARVPAPRFLCGKGDAT